MNEFEQLDDRSRFREGRSPSVLKELKFMRSQHLTKTTVINRHNLKASHQRVAHPPSFSLSPQFPPRLASEGTFGSLWNALTANCVETPAAAGTKTCVNVRNFNLHAPDWSDS